MGGALPALPHFFIALCLSKGPGLPFISVGERRGNMRYGNIAFEYNMTDWP